MKGTKSYRKLFPACLALLVVVTLFLSSCNRDRNNPGYVYFPDMDVSRAYDTYTGNPVFEDGKTLREPVEGTIPRGYTPYPYAKNDTDLALAGKAFHNPYYDDTALIERGGVLYNRFCDQCHGVKGDGLGILYTSGRFPLPPGVLKSQKVKDRPDGEIFHIMTVGYGIMGSYGAEIRPKDRWKIILYIRNVLQADSVPPQYKYLLVEQEPIIPIVKTVNPNDTASAQ
jgi:mono/diheme cytochrome c family protein